MEQDGQETTGVTRGHNVIYLMPHDWASIPQFLGPVIDRVDVAAKEAQLLVVTADVESAIAVGASAIRLTGAREIRTLAATVVSRANRVLKSGTAQILVGTAPDLLALVQGSALKLEQLKAVVLAWADELIAAGGAASLEALMAGVPKEASRVIVASEATGLVDALVERYARRARRVTASADDNDTAVRIDYLTVSPSSRLSTLRRVLDDLDPARAVVYTRVDESEENVRGVLRVLGYGDVDSPVRVGRNGSSHDLVVLFDLPTSRVALRESIGPPPRRVIALVQPRQVASLRALAAGGAVTPLTLPEAGAHARGRDAELRAEFRANLARGTFARELLALEPLLEEYDGIEIAAVALHLLERERSAPPSPASGMRSSAMARVFINVGAVDSARPADIVGAIANEAGVPHESIGKVDIRENHSIVEIALDSAANAAAKLTGTTLRGRRVQARIDQERPLKTSGPVRVPRDRAPETERPRRNAPRGDHAGSGRAPRDGVRDRDHRSGRPAHPRDGSARRDGE